MRAESSAWRDISQLGWGSPGERVTAWSAQPRGCLQESPENSFPPFQTGCRMLRGLEKLFKNASCIQANRGFEKVVEEETVEKRVFHRVPKEGS